MKVLHINTCGNLGIGNIASDIIRMVNAKGGKGILAYARKSGYADVASIKIGDKTDVYVHVLMTRLTDRTGFYSRRATMALIQQIKMENPDVIHLHNLHGYYLHIGVLFDYLKECGKPIVWTLHDCWPFTGHCAYFTAIECNRYQTGCHDCPQKIQYPSSIIMDQSARNYAEKKAFFTGIPAMTLITPSEWMKGIVKSSFLKEYDCRVICNGVDAHKFYPRDRQDFRKKYHLENKNIILGVANIWSLRKGYDDFVALSKLISPKTKLVMIGLSRKQIGRLPKEILGLERTSSVEQLAEAYSAADMYFNASVEETMGLTTMEAILCGTPVVVYDVTAIPECVTDKNGFVVKANDVKAVANLINSQAWKQFGAKLDYDSRYLKEISCEKYYKLYEEVIEKYG